MAMASVDSVDVSSEDECLLVVKRKAEEGIEVDDKRPKYYGKSDDDIDDSDNESIVPQVLVRVEVEEFDEDEGPLDYSTSKDQLASTSSNKKKKKRQYVCQHCSAVFHYASDLRTHSVQHQVETRHKCEYCGRCFNKAFSLKLHQKVHEDREEKCPLCELTFTQKMNLGRHLKSHEQKEQCKLCPAKFHTARQLNGHVKTHGRKANGVAIKSQRKKTEGSTTCDINTNITKTEIQPINDDKSQIKVQCLKREDLSHPTQCAIVSKMYKGRSINDICRLYNVTSEVVNEIWEEREMYKIPKRAGKRATKYLNGVLDTRLLEWLNEQRSNEIQVTGKMLQDVAEAYAKDSGFVAFNGSKKWLDRFKTRYKISFRHSPRKREYYTNNIMCESKWKVQFFKEQWCDARFGFVDEDIYTGDEVGVYYNPSRGRIKKQAGKKFIHGSVKDRLSIFMCTNVTGSDKKKLLVCGSEDPLIHSHRHPDTLPVTYIRHSQAHFTTNMFEEYVKYWNRELMAMDKKALLILDRATIHTKLQLSNLKLVFVPWKASTTLMPIKNGIYTCFRNEFRRLLVQEKTINILKGIDRNLTCFEALNMLEKAWNRTPRDIIVKSFESTGYDIGKYENTSITIPKVLENDEEEFCRMLKDFDVEPYFADLSELDMYLTVDEELLTGQGTNGSVFGGNHRGSDPSNQEEREREEILPISTEKPETEEKEQIIKRNRALQDLEFVRKYLESSQTSFEIYCSFMEVEKFLYKVPMKYES